MIKKDNSKRIEKMFLAKAISHDFVRSVQNELALRSSLFHYFEENPNRDFALKFLKAACTIRKKTDDGLLAEVIMLGCYLVGMHGCIEDVLEIWTAKYTDFDTYAGVDIQLIAFLGIEKTLNFLKNQPSELGKTAYDYTLMCYNAGDFEHIESYFSKDNLPYYFGVLSGK